MTWGKATTTLAVAAGAILGALVAITRQQPEPPAGRVPFTPVAELAPAATGLPSAPTVSPAGVPVVAPSANANAAGTLDAAVVPTAAQPPEAGADAVDAAAFTLGCARGDAGACLQAARALDDVDGEDAKLHRRLAVKILAEDCTGRRDPVACWELARLYGQGLGVKQSDETRDVLRQRARTLCQARPSEACAALN